MALNIKDEETDRLARELAELTDQSITAALREAIERQLERVRAIIVTSDNDDSEVLAIMERGRARTVLDDRSEDEILGYNQWGVPE